MKIGEIKNKKISMFQLKQNRELLKKKTIDLGGFIMESPQFPTGFSSGDRPLPTLGASTVTGGARGRNLPLGQPPFSRPPFPVPHFADQGADFVDEAAYEGLAVEGTVPMSLEQIATLKERQLANINQIFLEIDGKVKTALKNLEVQAAVRSQISLQPNSGVVANPLAPTTPEEREYLTTCGWVQNLRSLRPGGSAPATSSASAATPAPVPIAPPPGTDLMAAIYKAVCFEKKKIIEVSSAKLNEISAYISNEAERVFFQSSYQPTRDSVGIAGRLEEINAEIKKFKDSRGNMAYQEVEPLFARIKASALAIMNSVPAGNQSEFLRCKSQLEQKLNELADLLARIKAEL